MNPTSPIRGSSGYTNSEAKMTSNFQAIRFDLKQLRESNISNNQSNLMSHDYSYSPDFRDPIIDAPEALSPNP